MKNYCYIDSQNLHLGTAGTNPAWHIDLAKFRVYLREKYKVEKAFYDLGYVQEGIKIEQLYENVQNAGFILVFRRHKSAMLYKEIGAPYFAYLDGKDVKRKIALRKRAQLTQEKNSLGN